MANYTITCKCGHTTVVKLTGSWEDRKDRIEEIESRICPECYRKERAEQKRLEIEKAVEESKKLKLPELTNAADDDVLGKAIYYRLNYINNVRSSLDNLDGVISIGENSSSKMDVDKNTLENILEFGIKNYTDAMFWVKYKEECLDKYDTLHGIAIERIANSYSERFNNNELRVNVKSNKQDVVRFDLSSPNKIVLIYYQRDKDFNNVVKSNYYQWDGSHWFRELDEKAGSVDDRVANIGYHLLQNGFEVEFLNKNQHDMAVNRTYKPEQTRWIEVANGEFAISWKGYSEDLYKASRKITGSKWMVGNYVAAPFSSFKGVQAFAANHGFVFSEDAEKVVKEFSESKSMEEIKEDEPIPLTIREIRERTGLTQVGFARKYGIPKRTFEGWEMGERVPAPYLRDLIERVAKEDYPERWEEFEKKIKD